MSGLGVVAALPAEARALGPATREADGLERLDPHTLLAVSGMGLPAAAAAATRLLEAGCERLLCFGLAGGLDPRLAPGAMLIPRAVRTPAGVRLPSDRPWQARMLARLSALGPLEQGDLLCAAAPLSSAADKARAHAASGAVAVDMESAAIAELAARQGLPWLVVRVVVDAAQDSLPRAVAAASTGGSLKPLQLAGGLVRHPGEIAGLLKLAARFRVARAALQSMARAGVLGA